MPTVADYCIPSWLDLLVKVAQMSAPFIFLASLYVAWRAFARTQHLSYFQKSVDAVMNFNARYEALIDERHAITGSSAEEKQAKIPKYFEKFWSLQSDQFDFFLLGLVDPITFTTWSQSLMREFRNTGAKDPSLSMMTGWENHGRRNSSESPLFIDYVKRLVDHANEQHSQVTDRTFCMAIAQDVYDREDVRKFRRHMLDRDPHKWDWELEIFKPPKPKLKVN